MTAGQAACAALAAILAVLAALAKRRPGLRRRWPLLLAGLAAIALIAHLNFLQREHLHTNEFFHYYVGTKYFPEVGYAGLYDAVVIADLEDDPASHAPAQGVRSLTTYGIVTRQSIGDRRQAITERFPAARWAAFKEDVAFFRAADGPLWTAGESLRDHGYNGTPLVTAILGSIARQPFLPPAVFIRVAAWLDVALVVLAAAWIGRALDPATGALFLFAWAVNPLNDYGYVGGAYLRTLHLLALAGALVAYARGRLRWSGVGCAIAALLRVFPILFPAGLLAQGLLSPHRRRLLRERAPLLVAAVAAGLAILVGTALWPVSGGAGAWSEFAGKMALHRDRLSPNVVGLADVFFYDPAHDVATVRRENAAGRRVDWSAEARKTLEARALPYALTVIAALVLLGRRLRRGADADGWFAGFALLFLLLHVAHYDYALLALVPLVWHPLPARQLVLLLAFFVAAGLVRLLPGAAASLDARFVAISALLGVYLLVALHWGGDPGGVRPPPAPRRRG